MKGDKPFLSLVVGILTCVIMAGCASHAPQNGPGALNFAQFTITNGVVGISYRFLLVASGGVKPYTYSISAGSLPPGLSLSTDGVISGTPTQTGTFNFTAKVVDSQTPTAAYTTLATSMTINPVLSFNTSALPPATVGALYSTNVTASNGLPPYTFTLIKGQPQLPDGLTLTNTLNQQSQTVGTISGTATTAGVYTFPIQVVDALNEVATAQFTLTVIGRLQGPYVLNFNGFDNDQPFYMVAQLVASGDHNGQGVIDGVLDQMGPGSDTATAVTIDDTKSSYNIGQGSNFGTLTITRKDTGETYNFAMVVSTAGDTKVILNNTSTSTTAYGSGLLKKQTAATLTGGAINYSFGLFGNDTANARYAGAGMFALAVASNGSQAITGGEEDLNDNGSISSQVSITGGSLVSPDPTTGRGTYSLTTASGTVNYVYYVVSPFELSAMGTDTGGPFTLVDLQQQQFAGASGITNAALKGQSVIGLDAVAMNNGSLVPSASVGVAAFDGNGNIVGPQACDGTTLPGYYLDQKQGPDAPVAVQYTTGTYTIDQPSTNDCVGFVLPCGRVTVNLSGATTQPVWYLSNTNQGFSIDTDAGVTSGALQYQNIPSTPPTCPKTPFSIASIVGSYLGASVDPVLPSIWNELDVAITPPNPHGTTFSQTYDASGPGGQYSQVPFTGNYDCGATLPGCSDLGAYYGRFRVLGPGSGTNPILYVYVLGSGSSGLTGGKGGLVGINVGLQYDGSNDPQPRLTEYSH